jgi:hypothetical protein
MPISDYAHHNEEAQRIWWEEEGKHMSYRDDYDWDEDDRDVGAAQAYSESLGEMNDAELLALLADDEYHTRWPKAKPLIKWEINFRGLTRGQAHS